MKDTRQTPRKGDRAVIVGAVRVTDRYTGILIVGRPRNGQAVDVLSDPEFCSIRGELMNVITPAQGLHSSICATRCLIRIIPDAEAKTMFAETGDTIRSAA
jgi:hypothetical protein